MSLSEGSKGREVLVAEDTMGVAAATVREALSSELVGATDWVSIRSLGRTDSGAKNGPELEIATTFHHGRQLGVHMGVRH